MVLWKCWHFKFVPELWPFENFGFLKLVIKISQKYVGEGIETWSADRGWWVDYLIKFKKKIHLIFPELWPFENLGILNLSARYRKNYLS